MSKLKKNEAFDSEEQKIMEALDRGDFTSVKGDDLKKRKETLKLKAKATLKEIRKPISFKPDPAVLSAFKEKAEEEGLGYQTLLNLLMKQYVENDYKVKIVLPTQGWSIRGEKNRRSTSKMDITQSKEKGVKTKTQPDKKNLHK